MFFVISKIFWPLVAPLNLIFLLLVAGVALSYANKRLAHLVLIASLILFVLGGIVPIGHNAVVALENQYPARPDALPARVSGIIILGGMFNTSLSSARGQPVITDSAERLIEGTILERKYPSAMIIFTGGEGKIQSSGTTEAMEAEKFLQRQDLTLPNLVFEDQSRNTYENAVFTKDMILPQPDEHWILISSAYHMPRAMAVFKAAGWTNITPWETDYRTSGNIKWLPESFNISGNMHLTEIALHEYLGYFIYKITGKLN